MSPGHSFLQRPFSIDRHMSNEDIYSQLKHTRPSASARWDQHTCDVLKMVSASGSYSSCVWGRGTSSFLVVCIATLSTESGPIRALLHIFIAVPALEQPKELYT